MSRRTSALFGVVAFGAIVAHLAHRETIGFAWKLLDFQDQVYYPAVALLEGQNPYDRVLFMARYPVGLFFGPYSPLSPVLHLPFALLPFEVATVVYFSLQLVLTLAIASLTLRMCGAAPHAGRVLGLATLILLSRPGHWNQVLGQLGTEMTLATYVALYFARTRPAFAGLALAFSTLKPTFGGPLLVLMLARGDTRAVSIGVTIAAILTAAATTVIAAVAGGIGELVTSLGTTWTAWNALETPHRADTIGLISYLFDRSFGGAGDAAISVGLLAVGALALHRLARRPEGDDAARTLAASIACLTLLTCTYHLAYDAIVLTLPLARLAIVPQADPWPARPGARWLLLGLLAVPALNHLHSATAQTILGPGPALLHAANLLDPAAVLATLLVHVGLAFHLTAGQAPAHIPPWQRPSTGAPTGGTASEDERPVELPL